GDEGQVFKQFVSWVVGQIHTLGGEDYTATLHFDLYGSAGYAFNFDIERIAAYLALRQELAAALPLNTEAPADFGSKQAQIEGFQALRAALRRLGSNVRIVADEWCDTLDDVRLFASAGAADMVQIKMPDIGSITESLEALLMCHKLGIGAFL